MRRFFKSISRVFAVTYFQSFFEFLHYISLKGMNYGAANGVEDSGELSLVKELRSRLPKNPIIFDVGANYGQYLHYLLYYLNPLKPTIHVFEPDVKAFSKLVQKYGDNPNIVLNNTALGNKIGTAELYMSNEGGVNSSLIDSNKNQCAQIKVDTLDSYCDKMKVSNIHFMKLDVEGYERYVLKGAKNLIKGNAIKHIQIEHGSLESIIANTSLYVLFNLLPNYRCYHIKQNGYKEIKYAPKHEIFYNSNYYFKLE